MNTQNGKSEDITTKLTQPENNIGQTSDKGSFNIILPKEGTNKKSNKKESKNIKMKNEIKNTIQTNKENNLDKNKLLKAYNRLDIQNIMNSDIFAENYMFYPCKNEMVKSEQDPNYVPDFPYSSLFYDNILLRDESIFFIDDKTQKQKFLEETEKQNLKNENIDLNFGEDPCDKYYEILRSNTPTQIKINSIKKLQDNLNHFHVFQCRIPNYINVNMENFKENEILNVRDNFEQANSKNESAISTRINSHISNLRNNLQLDENAFMLNNVISNDEDTDRDLTEDNDKKFINKKRKLKK